MPPRCSSESGERPRVADGALSLGRAPSPSARPLDGLRLLADPYACYVSLLCALTSRVWRNARGAKRHAKLSRTSRLLGVIGRQLAALVDADVRGARDLAVALDVALDEGWRLIGADRFRSRPALMKRSRISLPCMIRTISAPSRATISRGVRAGAQYPSQPPMSKPGSPAASASGGSWGKLGERSAIDTP